MTGGQYSPTTNTNDLATTAPFGNIDKPFDICDLAIGAGATFVARSTAYHAKQAIEHIKKGINNKGFSLIEGISLCPTYYGRKNKKGECTHVYKRSRKHKCNVCGKALHRPPKTGMCAECLRKSYKNK